MLTLPWAITRNILDTSKQHYITQEQLKNKYITYLDLRLSTLILHERKNCFRAYTIASLGCFSSQLEVYKVLKVFLTNKPSCAYTLLYIILGWVKTAAGMGWILPQESLGRQHWHGYNSGIRIESNSDSSCTRFTPKKVIIYTYKYARGFIFSTGMKSSIRCCSMPVPFPIFLAPWDFLRNHWKISRNLNREIGRNIYRGMRHWLGVKEIFTITLKEDILSTFFRNDYQ